MREKWKAYEIAFTEKFKSRMDIELGENRREFKKSVWLQFYCSNTGNAAATDSTSLTHTDGGRGISRRIASCLFNSIDVATR